MNKDAWGYVRLSQKGRDASIDVQKEDIREYCRNNDELQLVTTLNDGEGTSGFDNEREYYQRLLSNVEDGSVDAIVTRDRDRLARDFDERLRLILTLRNSPVEWHVVEYGGRLRLEDPERAMMECVQAGMGHVKKMAEIERAKEVVEERQEKGYYQGQPPLGMQFDDDGRYLVPGERFETALEIVDRRENGESEYSVAKDLDISRSSVSAVMKHKERYIEHAE